MVVIFGLVEAVVVDSHRRGGVLLWLREFIDRAIIVGLRKTRAQQRMEFVHGIDMMIYEESANCILSPQSLLYKFTLKSS